MRPRELPPSQAAPCSVGAIVNIGNCASKITIAAFVVINLAAVMRVLAPMMWPTAYAECVQISGGLWAIAFAMFLIVYGPICVMPRVDGRDG